MSSTLGILQMAAAIFAGTLKSMGVKKLMYLKQKLKGCFGIAFTMILT